MESTTPQSPEQGFEATVRPLFRSKDRDSMIKAFDLWSYDDVVAHHNAILREVEDGKMPCDGPWPVANVATLRAWIAVGCPR
jgi:hypothetical protein